MNKPYPKLNGNSHEVLTKIELLSGLTPLLAHWPDMEIVPEANKYIDLTVQTKTEKILLELKTFPTNYGHGGKPITNFVQGVADLAKLQSQTDENTAGLSIWMAYIVPEPTPPTWQDHLKKIKAASAGTLRSERIPLWEAAFANLYVMESK